MTVKIGRFEMPKTVVKDERTATSTYAKFMVEPLESGYGHTMGNSLRRVLLSSLEGASISAVKIEGAFHEFCAVPGVVEDVTDVILNLKKVLLKMYCREPRKVRIKVKDGEIVFPKDSPGKLATVEGTFSKTVLTREEAVERAREEAKDKGKAFDASSVESGVTVYEIAGLGAVIAEK